MPTSICHACQLGKSTRLSFSSSEHLSYFPFQLVHCDVWTSPVTSNSGLQYYLVVLDDYSHFVWTFPLRHKSDVLPTLQKFQALVRTHFQLDILTIQTDNGREFDNHAARAFLSTHGILLRMSCPYTSPQNGRAERILRTLNDIVRTMLIHANMPFTYWAEALNTATFLLNRRPCRARQSHTPFYLMYGAHPDYSAMHACLQMPLLPKSLCHHRPQARSSLCALRVPWVLPRSQRVSVFEPGHQSSHHLAPCRVRRNPIPLPSNHDTTHHPRRRAAGASLPTPSPTACSHSAFPAGLGTIYSSQR